MAAEIEISHRATFGLAEGPDDRSLSRETDLLKSIPCWGLRGYGPLKTTICATLFLALSYEPLRYTHSILSIGRFESKESNHGGKSKTDSGAKCENNAEPLATRGG